MIMKHVKGIFVPLCSVLLLMQGCMTERVQPVRSYDVAIADGDNHDLMKPLAVVYEWTGKGLVFGVNMGMGALRTDSGGEDGREVAGAISLVVTSEGFVVELAESLPIASQEMKNLIVNAKETVIGYTEYEFDEKGRIMSMKLYPLVKHAGELVKTTFFYDGNNADPYKTEVASLIEKKVRTIQ